jgi:C4-dicarboxylate-specific signal transduction histidine kinase
LGLFANQAAVAIENARAFEEVARLRCQLEGERDYLQEQIAERKQAEEALRQAQADLTRANRMSSMGELTASLAREAALRIIKDATVRPTLSAGSACSSRTILRNGIWSI